MLNVQARLLGYPRVGPRRELKWLLERAWRGEVDAADLTRQLELRKREHLAEPADPPVYLSIMPPFSERWVRRITRRGAHPISASLGRAAQDPSWTRSDAWRVARAARRATDAGFSGAVLMGCRFETVVDEAHEQWRPEPDRHLSAAGSRTAGGNGSSLEERAKPGVYAGRVDERRGESWA